MALASYSALSRGITSNGLALKCQMLEALKSTATHGVFSATVTTVMVLQVLISARSGLGLHRASALRQSFPPAGDPWTARTRTEPPSPGHSQGTSALESGSKHSRLVVKTCQQFPGLLNTQKTIISRTSLHVFLSTSIL